MVEWESKEEGECIVIDRIWKFLKGIEHPAEFAFATVPPLFIMFYSVVPKLREEGAK